MTQSTSNLLEVRNLSIEVAARQRSQKPTVLVDDVSFNILPGKVLGLIGESGAGKSTIGLAALGYLRPGCKVSGGSITIGGLSVFTNEKLRGESITYVPQSAAASFNPAFRLVTQVIETAVTRGVLSRDEAKTAAEALFKSLGLTATDFGNRFPHQVSGGQLQRAATAMALCTNPKIVVFDEPTTALDVTVQVEVLKLIQEVIRGSDLAAIYISHDLAVVAQVADEIMVLRHGKMVEHAPARSLIISPEKDYTKQLLSVQMANRLACNTVGEKLLSVHRITAGYGELDVVKDVSFDLSVGQTLAIVGESGSGKSSMARVITGLLAPRLGTIDFCQNKMSASLKGRTLKLRKDLQLIYQSPDVALNPRQTIEKILSRPLQLYFNLRGTELRDRVIALLEQMELNSSFLNRLPGELSGGQKQRVCIARALAASPKMIICDEVTSALDPLVADSIVRLLMKIQQETRVAYIFITHDIALVRAVADQVIVMSNGTCVEKGDATSILDSPKHTYTKTLIESVPKMELDWLKNLQLSRLQSSTVVMHEQEHGSIARAAEVR